MLSQRYMHFGAVAKRLHCMMLYGDVLRKIFSLIFCLALRVSVCGEKECNLKFHQYERIITDTDTSFKLST